MPDPFWRHWWCQMQVLGWVYCRNPDVVRDAAPPEPFESTLTRKELRDLGRHGACYPHFADAEDAAIEALQAGRLTGTGVANGEGKRKEIPSLAWLDLVFRYGPNIAGPKDLLRIRVTCWYDLRFQRKAVLEVWPDPLELPAMADEQKTLTTAEGNANVEPRTRNKREDLFRSRPPAPAESESPSTLPSDLVSRYSADLADKRWGEPKQKREAELVKAESVARERWKNCDDDHAKMTSWLQNEYPPDEKTLPFADNKLTKHLRERMAKVAREIGKPVRGEKKSPG